MNDRAEQLTEVIRANASALAAILVALTADHAPPTTADEWITARNAPCGPTAFVRGCQSGEIEGATKAGRAWRARRSCVEAWMVRDGERARSKRIAPASVDAPANDAPAVDEVTARRIERLRAAGIDVPDTPPAVAPRRRTGAR